MLTRLESAPYQEVNVTTDFTVLPLGRREEAGLYLPRTGELVKELRAAGLSAAYYDPAPKEGLETPARRYAARPVAGRGHWCSGRARSGTARRSQRSRSPWRVP